jgi:ribosomal protein L37E
MFIGLARSPLRLIVLLGIAYGLAHWILGPAGVNPGVQLAVTFGATAVIGVIWSALGSGAGSIPTDAHCRECGGAVNTRWKACPHCGVALTGVTVLRRPSWRDYFSEQSHHDRL